MFGMCIYLSYFMLYKPNINPMTFEIRKSANVMANETTIIVTIIVAVVTYTSFFEGN